MSKLSMPLKKSSSDGSVSSLSSNGSKKSGGGLTVMNKGKSASAAPSAVSKRLSPLQSSMFDVLAMTPSDRSTAIDRLFDRALLCQGEDREFAITDLVVITESYGVLSLEGLKIINFAINDILKSGESKSPKDGGFVGLLFALTCLNSRRLCNQSEPFLLPCFAKLLAFAGDKSQSVRETSGPVRLALLKVISPYSFHLIYPIISGTTGMKSEDWRIKEAALQALEVVAPRVSTQLTPILPKLIPSVSECVIDTKPQVKTAAIAALSEACSVITNDDIRPAVPQLVSVIARPEESAATIDVLMETTFVQTVDSATLALIAPLLGKILRGRVTALKRKAAKVIESMCKLVQEPQCVAPFVPMLLPYLNRAVEEVVDPEVVECCKAAREILLKAMGAASIDISGSGSLKKSTSETNFVNVEMADPLSPIGLEVEQVSMHLKAALSDALAKVTASAQSSTVVTSPADTDRVVAYIVTMCSQLVAFHTLPNPAKKEEDDIWRSAVAMTPTQEWRHCIAPYATTFFAPPPSMVSSLEAKVESESQEKESAVAVDSENVPLPAVPGSPSRKREARERAGSIAQDSVDELITLFRQTALGDVADIATASDAEDANLCNIEFSLAFGGKILLHNTYLRLGKGRRYGVMGKNGAGKTTLLTNIGNGAIEGLPEDMKTVYVQHDDASDDHGVPLIDETLKTPMLVEANVSRQEIIDALKAIKFTDQMINNPRSALSGGWKMKWLIVKAMLARADVLLLDEPTNHLDAASVKWLEDYLTSQETLTCLIVSHDTAFMDHVINNVIHYENKKLVYYHGNLTDFVKIHPEAAYYYDFDSSEMKFVFPTPEKLDGVNSTSKTILGASDVTFTYPGADTPQLTDVNVKITLGSRVGILGPNGAGKSTLIKLLVQETEPDKDGKGKVEKHRNLRIAYVAQHSLFHVEKHMEESPVDYIKWRFGGGVDKEAIDNIQNAMLKEAADAAAADATVTGEEGSDEKKEKEKKYGDVVEVISRRKNGKYLEYEYTFFGQSHRDPNKYATLEDMITWGHRKLVEQVDTKIAAMAAGLDVRPVLTKDIQEHLNDFNLEAEYGTHSKIKRLSGGQKVKLVLAAAMWNRPHLLVLDEPTNYLDREALGALTNAIKLFQGGVLIISHHKDFTDALTTETWHVDNGLCMVSGGQDEGEGKGKKVKSHDSTRIRKSKSSSNIKKEESDHKGAGCTNSNIEEMEAIMNPKKLEPLTAKETKKLLKAAEIAGKSLKEYVATITKTSIEWKWL